MKNDPWEWCNVVADPTFDSERVRLRSALTSWQEKTNDAIRDPEVLDRLTREHHAIVERYYGTNPFGSTRNHHAWRYAEYLDA